MSQLPELSDAALDDKKFVRETKEPGKGKSKSYRSTSPRINVRDVVYDLETQKKQA